mmetsp:Transcript_13121/g.22162  ORF Transcript_13121/g.22162 Transcript_13121/m.22162 type:complete len:114 (+) Transcript_13121:806-1147(+)|eukprot:CAMPEP_0168608230 /NCGR_PEP_ID=MMETSP0449_2-20121227/512_1 /TAXON_ID=1082188 /ORGANISM="Strombidium rassoulzadegani, Strain ras09" /LENGTH=113 /DNA_ID=CAMNT_0008648193 /DNA_START=887 /DNA_END=1228 /DNA_ORIENTATION=+
MDGPNYQIVKRVKKMYFNFECKQCGHTWPTHYGSIKTLIAFKKDANGFFLENEVLVRIIAYRTDCLSCRRLADAGFFKMQGLQSQEHISAKYLDLVSYSIANTILRKFGYIDK